MQALGLGRVVGERAIEAACHSPLALFGSREHVRNVAAGSQRLAANRLTTPVGVVQTNLDFGPDTAGISSRKTRSLSEVNYGTLIA